MAMHLSSTSENLGNCNYSSTSIMDIPNDCLYEIFQKLDCRSDNDSFGLTCRDWFMVQNSSRFSLLFTCSNESSSVYPHKEDFASITCYKIHTLLMRFRNIRVLSLVGLLVLSNADLIQVSLCGSTLRSLYLLNCYRITDYGVSNIAYGCRFLSIICIPRTNVTDTGLSTLSTYCRLLKMVNISECYSITDIGISYLIDFCRKLHSLNISYCRRITGIGFEKCSKTLKLLDAESCNLIPEGVMEIVSGVKLKYLNIAFLRNVDGLAVIRSGIASRLRVLDLMMCRSIGDEMVKSIANGCCLLKEWRLAYCLQIGILGWKSIGLYCRNLERLHVYRCTSLCGVGLEYLRDGCIRLSILYTGTPFSRLSVLARQTFESRRPDVELNYQQNVRILPMHLGF